MGTGATTLLLRLLVGIAFHYSKVYNVFQPLSLSDWPYGGKRPTQ